jgi:cytosine/adenosine deaminase-related metal-dependent hydrolase
MELASFVMATEGSARVLGMGDFIGKIAKGYKADLVLLDLDHVNFVPLNNVAPGNRRPGNAQESFSGNSLVRTGSSDREC